MNNVPRYYRIEVAHETKNSKISSGTLRLFNMAYLETIISVQCSPILDSGSMNACNWKVTPSGADLLIVINGWDSQNNTDYPQGAVELWIAPNTTYMQAIPLDLNGEIVLYKI